MAAGPDPYGVGSIWLILLGAALALGGSIAVEVWRARRDDRRKVLLLKRLLQNEILTISKIFEVMSESVERSSYSPLVGIESIYSAVRTFDRNKELVVLIDDESLCENLYRYYTLVDVSCQIIERYNLGSGPPGQIVDQFRLLIKRGGALLELLDKL